MTNLFPKQKQGLKRFGRSDEGQALVLTALALVVLMLMAGLGVDVGFLRYQKQQMQKAADAGAIAGASALIYSGNWNASALSDTSANGFANGTNGITVAVNNPPLSGPFSGNDNYVEVIVSQPQPTFFMRVGGFDTVPVRSRAVASLANGKVCIYAMDPNDDPQTFLVDGGVSIASACGIQVNSSSNDALHKNGVSGSIIVSNSTIGVVGGDNGLNCPQVCPTPVTGVAPVSDPLAGVPAPIPEAGCKTGEPVNNVYHPGTYCGGITIQGNGSYTFAPGLYTLLGGFTASGNLTLTDNGSGVTFYNSFDATYPYRGISIGGGVGMAFSALTTGPQAGVLFFQDRRVPTTGQGSDFGGNSGGVYTGALYFPTTSISFKGTPDLATTQTIIVGWTLDFRGNSKLANYTLLPGGRGPIQSAALAE